MDALFPLLGFLQVPRPIEVPPTLPIPSLHRLSYAPHRITLFFPWHLQTELLRNTFYR